MRRPAILEIIAVNRSDDDMLERKLGHRLADIVGLVRIKEVRPTGGDVAKGAGTVQIEPRIIIVACFCAQHSPILGQAASSHTVTRSSSRMRLRVAAYSAETGAFTRNQSGRRGCGRSGLRRFSG